MVHAPPQIPSCTQGSAQYRADSARLGLWQGLIGLWAPLWGPTGGTLHDMSGYGHDGILSNMDPATDWGVGRYGYRLRFAATDKVVTPDKAATQPDRWSVFVLAKPGSTANHRCLFNWTTISVGFFNEFVSHRPLLYFGNNNYRYFAAQSYDTTAYYSFVVQVPGAAQASIASSELWINGRSIATYSTKSTGAQLAKAAFCIGSNSYSDWDCDSDIAAVLMWNRMLTPNEIQQLYVDPYALFRPQRRVPSMTAAIGGPYRAAAGGLWHTGAAAGGIFHTGQTAGQIDGRCG